MQRSKDKYQTPRAGQAMRHHELTVIDVTSYRGSPSGKIVECHSTTEREVEGRQVLVEVTHSGLCGTDEHYKRQDMVLGHEGVGVVRAIGPSVTGLKIGDRASWGYCHGSCRACDYCIAGQHLYCDQRRLYGATDLDQSSFASRAVWSEDFLFLIPDALSSAEAAPLMCAGAAVYSALRTANVRSHSRVGILGVGGLGHMAILFAAKMGCEVVVLSHSASKRGDALKFGAAEFYDLATLDGKSLPTRPVDALFLTGARQPEWEKMIPLVRRGGVISAMSVDSGDLRIPYMGLVMNGLSIQGSLPAPPHLHREMLRFVALHQIVSMVEIFSFTEGGINDAMERLRGGGMRYRGVVA